MSDTTGKQPDEAGRTGQATAPPAAPVAEAATPQAIVEADRRIAEAEQRVAAAEARFAEAERSMQRRVAELTARATATAVLAEADLPQVARTRVTDRIVGGIQLTDAGDLNETALAEAITAERDAEVAYIAGLDEARGVGRPGGLGQSAPPATEQGLSEADLEKHLAGVFTAVGMNESTAALAAKGR